MFNGIQQFETTGIKNLRKAEDNFIQTRDMANFINAIKEVVLHLGLDVIAETLENYDEAIRKMRILCRVIGGSHTIKSYSKLTPSKKYNQLF